MAETAGGIWYPDDTEPYDSASWWQQHAESVDDAIQGPRVAYTKVSLTAPWQSVSSALGVGYVQDSAGTVHLAGRLKTTTDPGSTLTFMAAGTIPAALRPLYQRAFPSNAASGSAYSTVQIFVNTDGSVQLQFNPGITQGIPLDHICWTPGV